jgi:hypothetical protein
MKIRVFKHAHHSTPNGKSVCIRKLPVKQTLVWLPFGFFVLIQKAKEA